LNNLQGFQNIRQTAKFKATTKVTGSS